MLALFIFHALSARRLAAIAAIPLALAATGAGAAEFSFVEGKLDAKDVKGDFDCSQVRLEKFDARGDAISGSWYDNYGSGNIDIVIKKNAIEADIYGMGIEGVFSKTERVGRDLHVTFEISHEDGSCELAFVLPGVLAVGTQAASVDLTPAPAPKPAVLPPPALPSPAAAENLARDMAAWRAVGKSPLIEDFQGYLTAFPRGQYAQLALVNIQRLAALMAARQQQEMSAWRDVQNSTRVSEFEGYLAAYPGGLFADLARVRVTALRAKAAASKADAELALWRGVRDAGDVAGFERYLGQFPTGRFVAEAESARRMVLARRRQADEQRLWAAVKDSRRVADLRPYLEQYPDGLYAAEARARVSVLEKFAEVAGVDFGRYHALVIGINDYQNLPDLKTALDDARAVAEILEVDYEFKVTLLENPSRDDIVDKFDELRETLGYQDNLLIYYAGHGWLDEDSNRGYWLPADAKPNRRTRWISNATLIDTLQAIQSKHVMIVADSCFSGTLIRGVNIGLKGGDYWRRMADKQARVAITSGGLEPVVDSSGGKNSPFATAFIQALRENETILDGTALFGKIRRPVMIATQQTPQYSDVRNAGHEGGDFLFVRKR